MRDRSSEAEPVPDHVAAAVSSALRGASGPVVFARRIAIGIAAVAAVLIAVLLLRKPTEDPPTGAVHDLQSITAGSASLELDDLAQIISYEEYYPYGSTSYQAVDRALKAAAKRYRYTGMERDKETEFSYHGVRYCALWLGRWVSCDPAGLADGPNLYRYVRDNPIKQIDSTGTGPEDDDLNFSTGTGPEDDDLNFSSGGMCRVPFALHVDEANAVKGDLAGGIAGSPSDPAEKQVLDSRTNVQTKSNFVSSAPRNPRPARDRATQCQPTAASRTIWHRSSINALRPLPRNVRRSSMWT